MILRSETPSDFAVIRAINTAAFAHHPFSRQTEHLIVEALRAAGAMTLSLVADIDGTVCGHSAFSVAMIGGEDCGWYMLGPVAVMPKMQRRGIGSALVRKGMDELRKLGAKGCVLVGDPAFYTRLGFACDASLVMEGVPPEVILCKAIVGPVPKGTVTHHAAFLVGL